MLYLLKDFGTIVISVLLKTNIKTYFLNVMIMQHCVYEIEINNSINFLENLYILYFYYGFLYVCMNAKFILKSFM